RHHYHYWSERPPRLLQTYLIDYLTAAGVADRVLGEDHADEARYRLHTRLERFDQIRGAARAGVEVMLKFELLDRHTGKHLAAGELSRTLFTDTGDASMHTTVGLFHSALEQMSAEWLQRLADAHP
ncbi:MAG TPA: ABC-type transport auxiliary lipoprotein family protein, partial [Thiohalobacter sp.]|nr:ABC-type transport auxiliary lipoprotein family protein [Thiohalobacter sp.]